MCIIVDRVTLSVRSLQCRRFVACHGRVKKDNNMYVLYFNLF